MTKEILVLIVLLCGVMGAITGDGLRGWRYLANIIGWAVVGPILVIALTLAISLLS